MKPSASLLITLSIGLFSSVQGQSPVIKRIPDKTVVLTFDDGVKSHYTNVGPLLKKYGFNATFFVCEFPGWPDSRYYMDWSEIQQLGKWGFDIGNHTWHHTGVDGLPADQLNEELAYIERKCDSLQIPKPLHFAYPGYQTYAPAVKTLEERGYLTARTGGDRVYDPEKDNPFYLPSFTMVDTNRTLVYSAFEQAKGGKIAIFTIHGVPDIIHPWVNTPPGIFEEYLRYLRKHHYHVISMQQLSQYIDFKKARELPLPE